jgi:osmotically-inducible protein OsmY
VLSGIVPTYALKTAAEAAAHRVGGVLDVANELTVKVVRKQSDEKIAHAVRQALQWGALIPDKQIKSTVTDGWVKLEGTVYTLTQRADAEWIVENLLGVAGVINELRVKPSTAEASTLKDAIEAALERRADREAERLRVEVKDGVVDLFGRVHSWPERKAVVGSISFAKGVRKVNDHLRIDPYF